MTAMTMKRGMPRSQSKEKEGENGPLVKCFNIRDAVINRLNFDSTPEGRNNKGRFNGPLMRLAFGVTQKGRGRGRSKCYERGVVKMNFGPEGGKEGVGYRVQAPVSNSVLPSVTFPIVASSRVPSDNNRRQTWILRKMLQLPRK